MDENPPLRYCGALGNFGLDPWGFSRAKRCFNLLGEYAMCFAFSFLFCMKSALGVLYFVCFSPVLYTEYPRELNKMNFNDILKIISL
jgi:hypothetical protein